MSNQTGVGRRFAYDGRGRVTTVFHPDTSTSTIIYSLAGEIQTRIDEDNATTTYTYNDLNQILTDTLELI